MTGPVDRRSLIAVRLPFHTDALLAYLAARAMPGVEEVRDATYSRVVSWQGQTGVLSVDLADASTRGQASVTCDLKGARSWAANLVGRIIDASTDVLPIEGHLIKDPRLRAVVSAQTGVRVPGATSPFELTVRAILGQQISIAGATTLASRIAERYGMRLARPVASLMVAFPAPADLAYAEVEQLGITRTRAEAIRRVARAVDSGSLQLAWRDGIDDAYKDLLAIPGIGPWTASYVALRALGHQDAIAVGDLGLRQALGTASRTATPAAVASAAELWRPFRGYATLHIWTDLLMARGQSIAARSHHKSNASK